MENEKMMKEMKSIIKMLFDGDINPYEQIIPRDPNYQKLAATVENEKIYLKEKWPADAARLEELDVLMLDLSDMYKFAYFEYGIKLGARLMLEIKGGDFCPAKFNF
jgi:hypothetical protein